jgi:hypothetical protein
MKNSKNYIAYGDVSIQCKCHVFMVDIHLVTKKT